MKRFLFIVLIMTFTYCCKSQEVVSNLDCAINRETIDSTNIESLILKFYQSKDLLQKSYDYELANKKRRMVEWSRQINIIGFGICLCTMGIGSSLAVDSNWSLAWCIPTGTILVLAEATLFNNWSKKIRNKADAIKLDPVYTYNLNNNTSIRIYTSSFNEPRPNIDGLCIGISTNF